MEASPATGAGEQLGARAASGVLWLAAQKWVVRVSGFITLIVLTRRVSPMEFGVVAAAMTVIPIVYLLSDLGLSTYLLQANDVDQRSLSTAFWSSLVVGAILSAGLVALAPLLAAAFRSQQLVDVLRALVLAVVPTVVAAVPLALLRRALAFRALAMQSLWAALIAQGVALSAAVLGAGVWALVGQIIVCQWVVALLAWRRAKWVPSLLLSPQLFREMTVFGFRVSTVDLVATARLWAESWIITVTLGTPALGMLNIAQRLIQVAQDLSAAPLIPVSTVVFAKVRESADRLRGAYLKALGVTYAVVAPIMVVIVVTAPLLIPLLFGRQWLESVPPARALAIAGIITLGAMLDHGLFYGLGRPGTWLGYSLIVDGLTVVTTGIAVRWGLTGAAVGFVCVALVATAARWLLVGRLLQLEARVVARPVFAVLIPTVVSMALGSVLLHVISGLVSPAIVLGATSFFTLVVNVILLRLLARGVIVNALSILPVAPKYVTRVENLFRINLTAT